MDDNLRMDIEVIEVIEEQSENSQNNRDISSDTESESSQSNSIRAPESSSSNVNQPVALPANKPNITCDYCKKSTTESNNLNSKKRNHSDEEEDDGKLCPICFDVWTNSGDHRLCSLRCGHLFGHSCLLRWLQGQRTCPTCKSAVRKTDIRFIYARKLVALDTSELNMLRKQLADQRAEKQQLEMQRIRDSFEITAQKELIESLKFRLKSASVSDASHGSQTTKHIRVHKQGDVKVSRDGGCRVMAFSHSQGTLAVSTLNQNPLFTGYGVRKINAQDLRFLSYTAVHSKPIRDLSYHPQRADWLLSVSLDKSARLIDSVGRSPVLNVASEQPLWSCCWDTTDPNYFYAGMSNGSVCKHDVRKADLPVMTSIPVPNDLSPVVALSTTSVGLTVCKLCSCWLLERWPEPQPDEASAFPGQCLPMDGPFVSMCYDAPSDNLLVSSRPNQNCPYTRHSVCRVTRAASGDISCNTVHAFPGAATQKLMTRSCQLNIGNGEVLVAADQEAQRSVHIWSVSSGQQVSTVSAYESALDLCHVATGNQHHLAVLNEHKLCIYKIEIS